MTLGGFKYLLWFEYINTIFIYFFFFFSHDDS